jgi:MoCo/4Fe-4S cofactor protein with predicted Tat translocation signal
MSEDRHINFKLLRERILSEPPAVAGGPKNGKLYWRSLEELADSPVFEEFVQREFPQAAEEWNDPVERRTFLKLMGASLALAGLSGCVIQPAEKVIPYVKQPEEETPGKGLWFATAFSLGGIATPLLARSNEGRPTKLEGNPDHPNNSNSVSEPPAVAGGQSVASDKGATATDIFSQASILTLYDPDRSQTPLYRGETRPWSQFVAEIRGAIDKENGGLKAKKGAGLRFLTETITSPTLAAQMKSILTDFPEAKWHQYEPVNRDNARAGAIMAFGQPVNTIYDFSKADRILSLGSDFLSAMPGTLRYARDYAARRRSVPGGSLQVAMDTNRLTAPTDLMNRLYVVESTPTITGANADHRFSVKPSQMDEVSREFARSVLRNGKLVHLPRSVTNGLLQRDRETLLGEVTDLIVQDLMEYDERSLIIAGDDQLPVTHAFAHYMNERLGNVGKTVFYTDPVEANSVDQTQSLRELVNEIDAGKVETLIIIGGNPAYNTPVDLRLDFNRLNKVKLRAHLSLYNNETSELCHWHIPATHYLESWGDARSYDGTATIVQPLIAPLYEGKTAHEVLALFSDNYDRKLYDIVRDYWRSYRTASGSDRVQGASSVSTTAPTASASTAGVPATDDFESWWRQCLHDGFVPNTALSAKTVALKSDWANALSKTNADGTSALPAKSGSYELVFRADPSIYDGRFANNGWLQELPKPLTKITWDNVALVSANTAKKLGINQQNFEQDKKGREAYVDTIKLTHRDSTISKPVPVWVMPGQPDDVITVHLGYGRTRAGRVGSATMTDPDSPLPSGGFNAYEIRYSDAPWSAVGATVSKTGEQYQIATVQVHFSMEGRDLLRESSLEEFAKDREKLREEQEKQKKELHDLSLYPEVDYQNQGNGYAWGMSIDLNSCVGCNACMVACQSENNIPIVGKEQVVRSREMHWIRVDAYFKGEPDKPEGPFFQPVPCMHCENAPCEPVCPVHATVHSAEGLNDMVYNRCVGTKYCSNNCPYKVRRFNFFLYQDWETPTYQLMRNPDVSVRSRGVMEKCTYCVQRIQSAKIQSELEGRPVRDGEIITACQSVCPTEAIVFGNINDPNSKVSKLKALERDYSLLGELNTRPRTTYLSALRNPNPEIKP